MPKVHSICILAGCALAVVAVAGCTDGRTGRIDPARTTLLGIGAGAATFGLGALIAQDQQGHGYRRSYGYGGGSYLPPVAGPAYSGGYGPYGRGYGW